MFAWRMPSIAFVLIAGHALACVLAAVDDHERQGGNGVRHRHGIGYQPGNPRGRQRLRRRGPDERQRPLDGHERRHRGRHSFEIAAVRHDVEGMDAQFASVSKALRPSACPITQFVYLLPQFSPAKTAFSNEVGEL